MTVNFAGHLYNDAGSAVNGASVKLLETGTTTQEGSTVTTDSNGAWAFTESDQDRYDVEITSGSSVRRIRWDDQISLKELDVRNNTGATTPAATLTNLTDAVANQVAVFSGANATRADGDEIYLSFKLANSAGDIEEFARITAEAVDVTDGSEDGQLRFGVAVANGTITDVFTINSSTGGAATISYEVDSFTIKGGEGEAGVLYLFADQGDDAGDEWKVNVADGGVLTIGNDIASAGTYVTFLTLTPHATTASSTVAIVGDATVGDDLSLTSDSSVFNMGAGNDFTITHDGTTGATLAGSPITVNSTGALTLDSSTDITLDADGADVFLKDGGTLFGTLTNSSGELVIKSSSSGTTAATFSGANVTLAGTVGSGAITSSGIIKTDDATEATSTTDGSLQTDGGLSVVKDAVFGDDVKLLSDSAVLAFGADGDATLTHTNDTGITLNSTNKLMFNDASQFVQGSSATVISIGATDEIDLTATAVDLNGTLDVSGNAQLSGTVTVGSDGSGTDVIFYSGTSGDNLTWDASEEVLQITGTNGATGLDVLDGDVRIVDTLYFYDRGGEYMSSNGSVLAIVGNTTVAGNLSPSADDTYDLGSASAAWQDLFLEGDITLTDAGKIDTSAGDLTLDAAGNVIISGDFGHVGIGNTSPDLGTGRYLTISGTGNEKCKVVLMNANPSAASAIGEFQFYSGTSTNVGAMNMTLDSGSTNSSYMQFYTGASGTPTLAMTIDSSQILHIGDTANANMTTGLSINQGAADNQILAFKSSDVGVAFTADGAVYGSPSSQLDANTFGAISKRVAHEGGLHIEGFTEAERGINMTAYVDSVSTTHTADGESAVVIRVTEHDGSNGLANPSADANIFAVGIYDGTNLKLKFIVDEDGDIFYDGSAAAYDAYDDAAMARAFDLVVSPDKVIRNKWDDFVEYNETTLVDMGILGDTIENRGLINVTQLQRLHNGAISQMREDMMSLVRVLSTEQQEMLPLGTKSRLALGGA